MRRLLLTTIPALLCAQSYFTIINEVDDSPSLKSAKQLREAADFAASAAKGKDLPTLDASLSGAWLKDTPTVTFRLPGTPPLEAPMGTKRNFVGSIRLAYPLFTGYAITAQIEKAELESRRAELKVSDLKRNLYLQVTELASACYSLQKSIEANQEAKKAMEESYKKAKGLYENGLLPPADLYNIEAKLYAIKANITETKSKKEQVLNTLGYLIGKDIDSVELPEDSFTIKIDKEALIARALESREDISALKSLLKISKSETLLAKSRLYPTIGVVAELKRKGDTLALNGDGFTNPDQSYIGVSAKWNLFNGFADSKMIEAANLKSLAAASTLNDYKRRVKTDIENSFLKLSSIFSRLQSAKMELKAQQAYCDLTKGRFENQLAGADELSRSIADLAAAKAKVSILEGKIFTLKASIFLMAGVKPFKESFLAAK